MNTNVPNKAITIAILAMGGEGGGVLADWVVDLAEHQGFVAQTTSVPGVAQRTGATIYYVEIHPSADRASDGRLPVLSLTPVPGHVDIVIASELMEAGRAIQKGLVSPDRTQLISSTHRAYSMGEKSAMGDGRVDSRQLIDLAMSASKRFIRSDYSRIARESGSVISAALFGALSGAQVLPFARRDYEAAIERGGIGVKSSLVAFAAGFDSVSNQNFVPAGSGTVPTRQPGPSLMPLAKCIEQEFPQLAREVLTLGIIRLADYQDEAYARAFIERLRPIIDLDNEYGDGQSRLLTEAARNLALWMSYEDAVRVADLKIRRTRFERVTKDVGCGTHQQLQIDDFFHPRINEVADILPAILGRYLLSSATAKRMIQGGRIVRTTSAGGFVQLFLIASLRRWRRLSLRFQTEQARIELWLQAVTSTAIEDYDLAVALCECPTLIKGYGDTHLRGNSNYDRVVAALEIVKGLANSASILRNLVHAALKDETGKALELALRDIQ